MLNKETRKSHFVVDVEHNDCEIVNKQDENDYNGDNEKVNELAIKWLHKKNHRIRN